MIPRREDSPSLPIPNYKGKIPNQTGDNLLAKTVVPGEDRGKARKLLPGLGRARPLERAVELRVAHDEPLAGRVDRHAALNRFAGRYGPDADRKEGTRYGIPEPSF